VIPDDELARMRRDAEALAAARLDERGRPVPMVRWGSRSYRARPEADVLALLDALAAERARADAAEARVRELEDGPMRELADLGQEMGVGYGSDFANPMIRPGPAELARLRQADIERRWVAGPGQEQEADGDA
jgi:hypothetical protein